MKLKGHLLTAVFFGAAALTACGSSDDDNKDASLSVDGGSTDASGGGQDATSGQDGSQPRDAAVGSDATPVDGTTTTTITEGNPCILDLTNFTDDCETGTECLPWNLAEVRQAGSDQVATCLRFCNSDADCVAPLTECVAGRLWGIDPGGSDQVLAKFCAPSASAGLGEGCTGTDRAGPMTGCVDGLECGLGYGVFDEADVGTCGLTCVRTATSTQGSCPTAMPYCNAFETSTSTVPAPGWCSTRAIGVGGACVHGDANRDCDRRNPGQLFCYPFGGNANEGNCLELCDTRTTTTATTTPACPGMTAVEIGVSPVCKKYDPSNANSTLGLCSAECESTPDRCALTLGDHACAGVDFPNPISFCAEVSPPYIAREWARIDQGGRLAGLQPTGHVNCAPASAPPCQAGSVCVSANTGGTDGACLTPCSLTATPSGCELYDDTAITCRTVLGAPQGTGLCGTAP